MNATDYGHGDMLEPAALEGLRSLKVCASNMKVEIEEPLYRSFTGGMISAFLNGKSL